ncbi:molybdopterin molybdotransferase MoeA [Desulfovibrio psychrotolerans]|uniref:Molybdopterin molybdenumtransferase n=1 Tax=Desulfovibrio psychrotolerans TaxID=415242 RepID=A0A7J0BUW0_9BACT|nr:gephyrin-like molybdotransferase Glp [Desulfovibrio psychrotolerans]GFM36961.1 molybdopterin molybdenumtransferase MoeA [Desulfovibrio psychrotolerans]
MKNGFFNVLSVAEFIDRLRDFSPLPVETAQGTDIDGRVLAEDVIAPEDLPLAHRSCMDGYALRARDVFGASESNPAYLESVGAVRIETPAGFSISPGECASIVTGGILPEGADAVIMVEHTEPLGAGTIEMRKSLAPHDNVMLRGEDASLGKVALAAGTLIRPQEAGLLAALGMERVQVHARPRVGILSTGDELVPVSHTPRVGQVRDVNSTTLGCCVRRAGAVPTLYGLVEDDVDSLEAALRGALEANDVVLLSGGSSVGTSDLTVAAMQRLEGLKIVNHGVAISPGKPLILGRQGNKAVWGLPGQVASAQVVMFVLGAPFLRYLAGETAAFDQSLWPARRARLGRNIASKPGREDYVRVHLRAASGEGAGQKDPACLPVAEPVQGKSGLLKTLILSHGVIRIPSHSEGVYEGTDVDVLLF